MCDKLCALVHIPRFSCPMAVQWCTLLKGSCTHRDWGRKFKCDSTYRFIAHNFVSVRLFRRPALLTPPEGGENGPVLQPELYLGIRGRTLPNLVRPSHYSARILKSTDHSESLQTRTIIRRSRTPLFVISVQLTPAKRPTSRGRHTFTSLFEVCSNPVPISTRDRD